MPRPTSPPRSAVTLEREGVAALPGGATRGPDEVVGAVALLAETAVLAAGGGEAAALAVLHHRLSDPLDAGVVADGGVGRVHGDHLQSTETRRRTTTSKSRKKEKRLCRSVHIEMIDFTNKCWTIVIRKWKNENNDRRRLQERWK